MLYLSSLKLHPDHVLYLSLLKLHPDHVLYLRPNLISFLASLLPKQVVLIRPFVIYDIFAGKALLLRIGEHCFAKKELKRLAFS